MEKDNLFPIDGGNKKNISKEELRKVIDAIPIIMEHIKITSMLRKYKFDCLIKEGFTQEQALFLSKDIF